MIIMVLKLKEINQDYNLNEERQQVPIFFAMCRRSKGTVTALHTYAKCRDYFNEGFMGQFLKHTFPSIYGFSLNPVEYKASLRNATLVLRLESQVKEYLYSNLYLLNDLEDMCGFRRTKLYELDKSEAADKHYYDYLYVVGDKRWVSATMYTSLYTYLLRLLGKSDFSNFHKRDGIKDIDTLLLYTAANYSGSDAMYALTFTSNKISVKDLMDKYDIITKNTNMVGNSAKSEDKYDIYHIHNNGGIQSFIQLLERYKNDKSSLSKEYPLYDNVINYYQSRTQ